MTTDVYARPIQAVLNAQADEAAWAAIEENLSTLPPERFAAYALSLAGYSLNAPQERAMILDWLGRGASRPFILWHLWKRPEARLHPYAARRLHALHTTVETKASITDLLLLDDETLVDLSYRRFLGRPPEAPGRAHWLALLKHGHAPPYVLWLLQFHVPAELRLNLPGDLSILDDWVRDNLSCATLIRSPDDTFIPLCYLRILGRPVEGAGIIWWEECTERGYDRWDIIAILLHSPEGRSRGQTILATQFIEENTYRQLRHRRQRLWYLIATKPSLQPLIRFMRGLRPAERKRRRLAEVTDIVDTVRKAMETKAERSAAELREALYQLADRVNATQRQLEQPNKTIENLLQRSLNEQRDWMERQDAEIASLRSETSGQLAELRSKAHEAMDVPARSLRTVERMSERFQAAYDDYLVGRTTLVVPDAVLMRYSDFVVGVPAENWAFVARLFYGHQWEPGTQAVLMRLAKPGMTTVDVGAHIGLLTLILARAVGPAGRVIAFEPTPRARDVLERNILLQGYGSRVSVQGQAVAESCGTIAFGVCDRELSWSSLYPIGRPVNQVQVPVTNLDTALAGEAHVDVVKIDAEGAELSILRGMREVIARNPQIKIIMEFGPANLRHANVDPAELFREISSSGLQAQAIDEATGAVADRTHQELMQMTSVNLLLSRLETPPT